jgi:N-acetylmuramoyl-L-alanine amidase
MALPLTARSNFVELTRVYEHTDIEFPHLRAVTLAQWAVECGWGSSDLARLHRNYAGMKWRTQMNAFATPVEYAAHDGKERYCKFASDDLFIEGYWARYDMLSAYSGWREAAKDPITFFNFVGPVWLGLSKKQNQEYVRKVLGVYEMRTKEMF